MIQRKRKSGRRRIGNAQRPGTGVLLPIVLSEQAHLIAIVFLVHQLAAELRMLGQKSLCAHIPATGGPLQVRFQIRRFPPAAGTEVAVGADFEIVCPQFATQANTAVAAGNVMVVEHVGTEHHVFHEVAVAHADVHRSAVRLRLQVIPAAAHLGEHQRLTVVVHGKQHIERTTVEASQQVQARRAKLAKPTLCLLGGEASCSALGIRPEVGAGPGSLAGIGTQIRGRAGVADGHVHRGGRRSLVEARKIRRPLGRPTLCFRRRLILRHRVWRRRGCCRRAVNIHIARHQRGRAGGRLCRVGRIIRAAGARRIGVDIVQPAAGVRGCLALAAAHGLVKVGAPRYERQKHQEYGSQKFHEKLPHAQAKFACVARNKMGVRAALPGGAGEVRYEFIAPHSRGAG